MNNGIWNKERGPIGDTGSTGPIGPDGPVFDGSTPLDELTVNGPSIFAGNVTQTSGVTSLKATTITVPSDTVYSPANAITSSGLEIYNSSTTDNSFTTLLFQNRSSFNAFSAITSITPASNYSELAFSVDNNNTATEIMRLASTEITLEKPTTITGLMSSTTASVAGDITQTAGTTLLMGLNVAPDTDISASIGNTKIFSSFSDHMMLAHYDRANTNDYAILQTAGGQTIINASLAGAVEIKNNDSGLATFGGSAISLLKPVTIGDGTGTGTSTGLLISQAISGNGVGLDILGNVGGGAFPLKVGFQGSSGAFMQINDSGVCFNIAGTWTAISDKRMKENFRDVNDPIGKAIDLADCVKQYNFKEGVNTLTGLRTQYIAQDLISKGFAGHVTETDPQNEFQGNLLGWKYADEETTIEVPEELDEEGNILTEASTETITKRVVTQTGEALLQVENNFAPYAFPAIKALKELNDKLEVRLTELETKLALL
jgi:hypothetical protein